MEKLVLTLLFCAFAGFAYAEDSMVIFPASYSIPWFSNSAIYTRCDLTEAEAVKADAILKEYLLSLSKLQPDKRTPAYMLRQINEIIPKLPDYRRQYFGITRKSDGHKCVWINCFLGIIDFNNWKEQLIEVDDGGSAFFNIKVDLDANQAFDLMINGVA